MNTSTKARPIRIQNKFIGGKLIGDTWIQPVCRTKHFLRVLNAWGKDKAILEQLRFLGCNTVRLMEREQRKIYSAPLSKFFTHGIEADFGQGLQVFLPEKEWAITLFEQAELFE